MAAGEPLKWPMGLERCYLSVLGRSHQLLLKKCFVSSTPFMRNVDNGGEKKEKNEKNEKKREKRETKLYYIDQAESGVVSDTQKLTLYILAPQLIQYRSRVSPASSPTNTVFPPGINTVSYD